jgi:hypothetical protein
MAKTYAKTVTVPAFDEEAAYNQDRPISSLIRTQLLHLTTVENLNLPSRFRTGININDLRTERDAGEYIQRVTAALHTHATAEVKRARSRRKTKSPKTNRRKRSKNAATSKVRTRRTKSSIRKTRSRK